MRQYENQHSNIVYEVNKQSGTDDYQSLTFLTGRGDINARYYQAEFSAGIAIFVGGVGGDWDSPSKGLYEKLCLSLKEAGMSSLRVRYRFPTILEEAVFDIVAAVEFAGLENAPKIALTGHSLGGAAVLQAGAISGIAHTVVTLSTQCYGADAVAQLPEGCSVLLLHGEKDSILPYQCSKQTYNIAKNPKQLILYADDGHNLDESHEEVYNDVYNWIVTELSSREAA